MAWSSICNDLILQDSRNSRAAAELHQKWIFIEEQLHDLVSGQQQASAETSGADKNLCQVKMCTFIFIPVGRRDYKRFSAILF